MNGARVQEEYVHDRTDGLVDMTVPKGTVFVMGDNRGESFDSRNMGAIPCEDLKGKVFSACSLWEGFGKHNIKSIVGEMLRQCFFAQKNF